MIIPKSVTAFIAPVSMIIVGVVAEKHYVGRVTAFTNVIALNVLFYSLPSPDVFLNYVLVSFLQWYANIGLILGVIAILSYKIHAKQSKLFYAICWCYSSIVVGTLFICIFFLAVY
ncbi:MAG: hypothetical protein JRN15_13380 [Nitrososphaerota archaeon]|nr:hypothetical protein [Nitrososphaerota archaeon]